MALRYEGWDVAHRRRRHDRRARRPRVPARTPSSSTSCCPTWTASRCCAGCAPTRPLVPVLFLTARDAVEDRIAGLTAGGDDYVTKPFSLEEVAARLRGLLRRTSRAVSRRRPARRRRPDPRRGQPRGDPRRRRTSGSPPPSSSCCATSCATPSGCCPRRRSSTGCGSTTSAARPTSSSSTSPTCAARSTPAATPMIHTLRGAGYVLKPAT